MSIKEEIIEYFVFFKKSNICFPKFFLSKNKKINEKKPECNHLFSNCGQKEGLQTWIINNQNKNPILMTNNPHSYKCLDYNNNYIFLKTSIQRFYHKGTLILKPKYLYEIYYWIGNTNNVQNNFSVSYYTTMLSYQFNIFNIFREEFQNETFLFKKLL